VTSAATLREQPPGRVRVASEVVGAIASLAALDTPGVAHMCELQGVPVPRPLRRQHGHRGVRLEMVGSAAIRLELGIAIEAGATVPELVEELQRRVARDIERMLGLEVVEVNVLVRELAGG
jgi:uncharacterized alkaline shock family protein YloU